MILSLSIAQPPNLTYGTVSYTSQVPVTIRHRIHLDTMGVQVFDSDGKLVKPAEVRKHLTESTKVLLSTDGKPIHPSFLVRRRDVSFWVIDPSVIGTLTPALPVTTETP
jgi:hypothetical protein